MNRAFRAIIFSGTLVGSAFFFHKRTKVKQMGVQGFPTPLPEFEGQTDDDKLADTVNRYSRMAPIYDQALDAVEKKYNGFTLREQLVSQAQGHVLEIGVGTARNLPYYDNSQVNSITFVDSTYPMLNAALVKVHDLYQIHDQETALATVEEKFPFEVTKALSFHQINQKSIDHFKAQFDKIAAGEAECGCDSSRPDHNDDPAAPETDKIIHSTYRPQILYPIPPNAEPSSLGVTFNQILKSFPSTIQQMFSSSHNLTLGDLKSTVSIEDEQTIGSKLLRAPEKPQSVQDQQNKQDPAQQSSSLITSTEGVSAATRYEIESYDSGQREVAKKISQGQSWKEVTKTKNVIPAAFVHLDCHDLSFFPSNSYDTVVDTFGLCSFHHPVDVLNEMRRICKPGGQILLLEHGLGTNPLINQVIRSTNDSHKKQWGCDRSKDIVNILSEAGYDVGKVKRFHGGTTVVWHGTPPKSTLELQEMVTSNEKQPKQHLTKM